jgi:thiamine-phosphate pyrophosphorylase
LKLYRHKLIKIEELLGKRQLLMNRNTLTDCFADENRPEELLRETTDDLVSANFKRAQEAARVIEEYSKLTGHHEVSGIAKALRFSFYTIEQDYMEKKHE